VLRFVHDQRKHDLHLQRRRALWERDNNGRLGLGDRELRVSRARG